MKIGALVRSYHGTWYLKEVLKQFSHLDKVLVLNCRFKDLSDLSDDTEEVVKELNQDNVELIKLSPREEHEVLNAGLTLLEDFDHVYICDADEFFTKQDLVEILKVGLTSDIVICKYVDVFDQKHIYEPRDHMPIVMIKPKINFYQTRCASGEAKEAKVIMKHYGLIKTDWKEEYWDTGTSHILELKKRQLIRWDR